jgi:hypothetical protein
MPGSSARVAPFIQRLSSLSATQKAAAVNLGIFPDSSGTSYAYAAPAPANADRLSDIDSLLNGRSSPPPAPQPTWQPPRAVQVAYARPLVPATAQRVAPPVQSKLWLQLASGSDVDAVSAQFRRLKAKNPELFDGIKPYVVRSADGARLVVGPFRGKSDADIFSEDLETIGVSPMKWTNSQTDRIAPLAAE